MLTQDALIQELHHRGVEVTPRRLTDWRAKGLLPRMVQHGRGRGPGAFYAWSDPDIVDRAVLVEELLADGVRGDAVVLGVWFAGYEVDPAEVRQIWLALTAEVGAKATASEDSLGDTSRTLSRAIAKGWKIDWRALDEVVGAVLSVLYDSRFSFDPDDFLGLAEVLDTELRQAFSADDTLVTDIILSRFIGFVRDVFSIGRRDLFLNVLTDDDIRDTHRRWRSLLAFCSRIFRGHLTGVEAVDLSEDQLDLLGRRMSVNFGRFGLTVLMYLANRGASDRLDASVDLMNCVFDLARPGSLCRSDFDVIIDRFWRIWSGFRFVEVLAPLGVPKDGRFHKRPS